MWTLVGPLPHSHGGRDLPGAGVVNARPNVWLTFLPREPIFCAVSCVLAW